MSTEPTDFESQMALELAFSLGDNDALKIARYVDAFAQYRKLIVSMLRQHSQSNGYPIEEAYGIENAACWLEDGCLER